MPWQSKGDFIMPINSSKKCKTMKLRENFMYVDKENGRAFSVRKNASTYRATYQVCFFTFVTSANCRCTQKTCKNRREAKEELIRLLRLYTSLKLTEILKLK